MLKTLLLALALIAPMAHAADDIVKPGAKDPSQAHLMFLVDSSGATVPAIVVYTTDGNGNEIPISGGGGGGGTVNQGTGGSSPWLFTANSLPLPTGAATSSLQTAANNILTTISNTLTSMLTALTGTLTVQGTVGHTANASGATFNSTSVGTSAVTVTAPANAVGFVFESESSNTANCRWAVGSTASASVGTLAEPGRDSGYVPIGANVSVYCLAASQSISVQWALLH